MPKHLLLAALNARIGPWASQAQQEPQCERVHVLVEYRHYKEGVFIRNISAAPICDHFTVGPPGSGIREVGIF